MMISEHKTASQEVREPRFANYRSVFCEMSSALILTVFNLFVRIIKRYSYILLDAVLLSEQKILSHEVRVLRSFRKLQICILQNELCVDRDGI